MPQLRLIGPVRIRRLSDRSRLLLSSEISRRKRLSSSFAVVFAAFVDTFSFKSQAGSRQKVFFFLFGVQESSQNHIGQTKCQIKLKANMEGGYSLLFSVFLLFYYCAQRERPRASVTFTCSPRPMKLNLDLEGFFICRAIR